MYMYLQHPHKPGRGSVAGAILKLRIDALVNVTRAALQSTKLLLCMSPLTNPIIKLEQVVGVTSI